MNLHQMYRIFSGKQAREKSRLPRFSVAIGFQPDESYRFGGILNGRMEFRKELPGISQESPFMSAEEICGIVAEVE